MRVPIALLYGCCVIEKSDRLWAVDEYYRMANKRIISPDELIVGAIRAPQVSEAISPQPDCLIFI